MSYSFLIVEDELLTARFIKETLEDEDYEVIGCAKSAAEARGILEHTYPDFILLDINIYGIEDGLQFAQSILDKNIAIIFISAYSDKTTLYEAINSFPYGFLVKPFTENDLLAVILVAISRRMMDYNKESVTSAQIQCHIKEGIVIYQNKKIELGKKELLCLNFFIKNAEKIVSYDELRKHIWQKQHVNDSTVRELINRLRNKIPNIYIKNVYGKGYSFSLSTV
jgi:DNA-binding response OmpR family regulator